MFIKSFLKEESVQIKNSVPYRMMKVRKVSEKKSRPKHQGPECLSARILQAFGAA